MVSQLLSEAQHYLSILESVRRHGWEYLEKRGEENDTTSTLDESKDTTDSSDMQKSAEANDTAHTDRRRAFIGSIIRDLGASHRDGDYLDRTSSQPMRQQLTIPGFQSRSEVLGIFRYCRLHARTRAVASENFASATLASASTEYASKRRSSRRRKKRENSPPSPTSALASFFGLGSSSSDDTAGSSTLFLLFCMFAGGLATISNTTALGGHSSGRNRGGRGASRQGKWGGVGVLLGRATHWIGNCVKDLREFRVRSSWAAVRKAVLNVLMKTVSRIRASPNVVLWSARSAVALFTVGSAKRAALHFGRGTVSFFAASFTRCRDWGSSTLFMLTRGRYGYSNAARIAAILLEKEQEVKMVQPASPKRHGGKKHGHSISSKGKNQQRSLAQGVVTGLRTGRQGKKRTQEAEEQDNSVAITPHTTGLVASTRHPQDDDGLWESDWLDEGDLVQILDPTEDAWISVTDSKRNQRKGQVADSSRASQIQCAHSSLHEATSIGMQAQQAVESQISIDHPRALRPISSAGEDSCTDSRNRSPEKSNSQSPSSVLAMSPPSSSFVVTAHSHSTAPEAPTTEPLSVVNECRGVHTKTPRKERRGSDSTGDTTSSASTVSDNYVEDATPFGISKNVKTSNEPFVYESESNATIELKRMLNLDSSASSHVTESREAPTIVDTDDAEVRKKFASTTHWPSNSSMSDTSSGSPPLEEQEHIQDPEASPRRQQQYSPQQRQQQQMTSIFPVPPPHPDASGAAFGIQLGKSAGMPASYPNATPTRHPHALIPSAMQMRLRQPAPQSSQGGFLIPQQRFTVETCGDSDGEAQMDTSAPADPERTATLRRQIEYYFSAQNLCHDMYLRSKMDAQGFVALSVLIHFNKIRVINPGVAEILEALKGSDALEAKIPWALRACNDSRMNHDALMVCYIYTMRMHYTF